MANKLIAVNGPPGSGKTTLAINFAKELHERTKKKVIYLSADTLIPTHGIVFPRRNKDDLKSLGEALDKVELDKTDFIGVAVTTEAMPNLGFLAYKPGEGPYTYAEVSEKKVKEMFRILQETFSYVVVDCDRDREDLISSVACGLSDYVVQVVNPDTKSIAYYGTEPLPENTVQVLNLKDNDVHLPVQDIKTMFPDIAHTVLYCRAAKMQMYEGTMMDYLNDSVFRKSVAPLMELFMKEPEIEAQTEEPVPAEDIPEPEDNKPEETDEFWQ